MGAKGDSTTPAPGTANSSCLLRPDAASDAAALAHGQDALRKLRRAGIALAEPAQGVLRVSPPQTAALAARIAAAKPAILAALRAEAQSAGSGGEPWPPAYDFPVGWEQEHRIEREAIRRRLASCACDAAEDVLRGMLAEPPPASEAGWLVELGRRWLDAEHALLKRGILPAYRWTKAGGERR